MQACSDTSMQERQCLHVRVCTVDATTCNPMQRIVERQNNTCEQTTRVGENAQMLRRHVGPCHTRRRQAHVHLVCPSDTTQEATYTAGGWSACAQKDAGSKPVASSPLHEQLQVLGRTACPRHELAAHAHAHALSMLLIAEQLQVLGRTVSSPLHEQLQVLGRTACSCEGRTSKEHRWPCWYQDEVRASDSRQAHRLGFIRDIFSSICRTYTDRTPRLTFAGSTQP